MQGWQETNNVYGVNYRMITDGSSSGFTGGAGFNGIVVRVIRSVASILVDPGFGPVWRRCWWVPIACKGLMQVPSAFVTVLNGLVVIFVVSSEVWRRRRQKRRLAAVHEDEELPPPTDKEKLQQAEIAS